MTDSETEFQRIAKAFARRKGVSLGKMMSSPGLKVNDKVFAFQAKDGMAFRLGPDFDPKTFGLQHHKPLNPFKTKPPLKGWYVVPPGALDQWEELAAKALQFTRTL